jgi:hypothetical protein
LRAGDDPRDRGRCVAGAGMGRKCDGAHTSREGKGVRRLPGTC